jgi:hypothetical protein
VRDARAWTHAALFGTLWGCFELSLGTVLHLGGVPLKGLLMGSLGLVCLVTLRRLQPRAGVCLLAGLVAMFLKVFSVGGVQPGTLIGIGLDAVLVELAFTATLSRAAGAVVGGALALAAVPVQMVLYTWVVIGPEAVRGAMEAVRAGAANLGAPPIGGAELLAVLVGVSGVLGAVVGGVAWRMAGRVARRVGRRR